MWEFIFGFKNSFTPLNGGGKIYEETDRGVNLFLFAVTQTFSFAYFSKWFLMKGVSAFRITLLPVLITFPLLIVNAFTFWFNQYLDFIILSFLIALSITCFFTLMISSSLLVGKRLVESLRCRWVDYLSRDVWDLVLEGTWAEWAMNEEGLLLPLNSRALCDHFIS